MSNHSTKEIRKQVRNVVQEVLAEVLTQELLLTIRKELTVQMEARLTAIAKHVDQTLSVIDERSKEATAYAIRNSK